jgi:DNA-directed RNA polymerase specialized sigma24 family protein
VIATVTETAAAAPGSTWERFEALYRASRDDLYAYVFTLLRDRAAAEDITALTFERAYRRRRTFDRRRGEERAWLFAIARNAALDELRRRRRGEERAWLFAIARNAALDELRRRRRVAALVTDPEDAEAAGPEDGAEVALRRTAVRTALAALPARDRELIALKFHAGLTNAELARVLGVSESNAGTMLHRTMEKLRKACNATA